MKSDDDNTGDIGIWCRDATYHMIRGLNAINDQSQRLCSHVDVTDCEYHLTTAIGYLKKIKKHPEWG